MYSHIGEYDDIFSNPIDYTESGTANTAPMASSTKANTVPVTSSPNTEPDEEIAEDWGDILIIISDEMEEKRESGKDYGISPIQKLSIN